MKKIEAIQITAVGKKKIASLLAASQQFEQQKNEVLDLVRAGKADDASYYVLKKLPPCRMPTSTAVAFADSQSSQLQQEGAGIIDDGTTAIEVTLVFSALAILAAVVMGWLLTVRLCIR